MEEFIKSFPNQFSFRPKIENVGQLKTAEFFVVGGMGGSHLPADFLRMDRRLPYLFIHKNYSLPILPKGLSSKAFFIAVSCSGETEETLDFGREVFKRGYSLAVVSRGGALIKFARQNNLPYIVVPDSSLPPRMAVGYLMVSLLFLMGLEAVVEELALAARRLDFSDLEKEGKKVAGLASGKIPVIYSSEKNAAAANYWKVVFNETGKSPAFSNVFPELNHNEMVGFAGDRLKDFFFVFLKGGDDCPRTAKRMEITEKVIKEKGGDVYSLALSDSPLTGILTQIVLANWASYYFALSAGADPLDTSMIENFKKLIA